MNTRTFWLVCVALLLLHPVHSSAFEKLSGSFLASDVCAAYQSKNKRTNPGNVKTRRDQTYRLLGLHKPGGNYYQIVVDGAPVTRDRWVHKRCGKPLSAAKSNTSGKTSVQISRPKSVARKPKPIFESTTNLLALSWQPAFCETKPNKTECKNLNDGKLPIATRQLSIHGLWPQPKGSNYCGVSTRIQNLDNPATWHRLPEIGADAETMRALRTAMPGAASGLDKHEWIKHGTCYGGTGGGDEYYDDTLWLTQQINNSQVSQFFANNAGLEIETRDIRNLFDVAFGDGAGDRVQFHCVADGKRLLVQEMKINLRGVISPNASVSDLMLKAAPLSLGCPKGVIDTAGLQ